MVCSRTSYFCQVKYPGDIAYDASPRVRYISFGIFLVYFAMWAATIFLGVSNNQRILAVLAFINAVFGDTIKLKVQLRVGRPLSNFQLWYHRDAVPVGDDFLIDPNQWLLWRRVRIFFILYSFFVGSFSSPSFGLSPFVHHAYIIWLASVDKIRCNEFQV